MDTSKPALWQYLLVSLSWIVGKRSAVLILMLFAFATATAVIAVFVEIPLFFLGVSFGETWLGVIVVLLILVRLDKGHK